MFIRVDDTNSLKTSLFFLFYYKSTYCLLNLIKDDGQDDLNH